MKKILFCCAALFCINTANASFCQEWCDPCSGWDFSIDWLYWNVRKSDMDFAIDGHTANDFPDRKVKTLEIDYNHGFRVAVLKECESFDFALRYVYFRTDDNRRSMERIGDILATRLHPGNSAGIGDVNTLDYARANYKAGIDTVDFEFGKNIEIDERVFIHPVFGFRYGNICQAMKTVYQEEDGGVTGVQVREKLDMNAFGLYLGSDASYGFCGCYSIFGRFAGGVYAADFNGRNSEFQYNGPRIGEGSKGDRLVHAREKETGVVGSCEISIGLAYDLCEFFCMDWKLSAGYEFHQWCGIPGFMHFVDDEAKGILTRGGSTLGWDGLFLRVNAGF